MAEALLSVKNLSLSFASEAGTFVAVDDISFEIKAGEILALVGESGSGKSLTAMSVLGLQPVTAETSGVIEFQAKALPASNQEMRSFRGKHIAYIPQDPLSSLNPVYTIGNQLAEAIEVHNVTDTGARILDKSEIKDKCLDALAKVGIPDPARCYESYPHELSGGMRQRVMIAMAVINEPDLIIADEPTTALDVTVQAVILDLLKALNKTILFITHDLGVVAEIADRVLVMREGKIVERKSVFDIFEKPEQDYTKDLLAAIPRL